MKYVYSIGFLEGNVKIGGIHYLTEPVLMLSSHTGRAGNSGGGVVVNQVSKQLVAIFVTSCFSGSGFATAAFNSNQLSQLVVHPRNFNPTEKVPFNYSVNQPTIEWHWQGKNISFDIALITLKSNHDWRLELDKRVYTPTIVGKSVKPLFEVVNDEQNVKLQGYLITGGPFFNNYFINQTYHDGSGNAIITTESFETKVAANSDYSRLTKYKMYDYPIDGYLHNHIYFCATPGVRCK